MIEQIGNPLAYYAFFTSAGVGALGLSVTVDVFRNGTIIVTNGNASEVGGGLYRYTLPAASVTIEGEYAAIFKTAAAADQKHIAAIWCVGHAGLEFLDAAISSRATLLAGTVQYLGPVNPTGDVAIVRGDDYKNANGRALTFTSGQWPNLSAASVALTVASGSLVALGPVTGVVDSSTQVHFDLTHIQTGTLIQNAYAFDVQATLADLSIATLLTGTFRVLQDRTP